MIVGGSACPPAAARGVRRDGHRGDAGLGHDRDEPGRLAEYARCPRPRLSAAARAAPEARSRAAPSSVSTCASWTTTAPSCPGTGASGNLMARGPWVCDRYFGDTETRRDAEGWFADRRRRHHRCRGLHRDHRPHQGHHQVGRRVDQLDRAGEHCRGPPRCRRGGGDRGPPSQMVRAPGADRGAEARPRDRSRERAALFRGGRCRSGGCRIG